MQVDRLEVAARSDVDEVKHQEDPQKQEARDRDDRVDRFVMQQVHEEEPHDARLDGGNGEGDHYVRRAGAELNIRGAHGNDRENEKRRQRDDVRPGFLLGILGVLGMRAHEIR